MKSLKSNLRSTFCAIVIAGLLLSAAAPIQAAGRPLTYRAGSFVLATGGFASAGLELDSTGKVREPAERGLSSS